MAFSPFGALPQSPLKGCRPLKSLDCYEDFFEKEGVDFFWRYFVAQIAGFGMMFADLK